MKKYQYMMMEVVTCVIIEIKKKTLIYLLWKGLRRAANPSSRDALHKIALYKSNIDIDNPSYIWRATLNDDSSTY